MFWKNDRNIIVALEVGSTKITAAVGELRADGSLALLGIGEEPSGGVRKCEITDFQTAQRCVQDALCEAERLTDVMINEVYLAISGAHIQSTNVRHSTPIESAGHEIDEEDMDTLHEMALGHSLPSDYALIHALRQHFVLDDRSVCDNPAGLVSKRLSADYHLVYGLATRLLTTIKCVKELSIDVKSYALSSYATAQSVLKRSQKQTGAVVINLGGGLTDYICYDKGAVVHTGVVGVGGEHVTQDLVAGLKIPYNRAEHLKKTEGSVVLLPEQREEYITMPASYNFEERIIYRESLVTIMQARLAETLEIILEDLEQQTFWDDFAGKIYFTGGASQVNGLVELAEAIFAYEVRLADQYPLDGDQNYANRPDLSTVLGLLQYARRVEMDRPAPSGLAGMRKKLGDVFAGIRLF